MCVCAYIYVCICMHIWYICIYAEVIYTDIFLFAPHMQDSSDMYHAVCTQYLFTIVTNKLQMCSPQFNLTRMFLNSFVECFLGLMILFHLLVNFLRVVSIDCLYVCRVCFVCASHQWCTVGLYRASSPSEWPCFQRNTKGFFHFFKKNGKTRTLRTIKWTRMRLARIFFSKKNGLTSGLTRVWRQASDVSPTPPDGLTSGATTK